jgi:hypothetical protein
MRAVSQYARRRGIRRFKSRKDSKIAPVKPAITLSAVEGELEALMARVEELKQKRASMLIRFERDGPDVLVYGVASGKELRATASSWLAFLGAEGARRLREFCLQAVKR